MRVEWTPELQRRWKTRFEAGTHVVMDTREWAFAVSRTLLTQNLPRNVTGVQAVTNYVSYEELIHDLGLKQSPPPSPNPAPLQGGTLTAILAREFLVLDEPGLSHEELLAEAVTFSTEKAFRRDRASFWRWQREFMDDKGITDESAIKDAVDEMGELLRESKLLVRTSRMRTASQYAFMIGSIALTLTGSPLTPVGLGGAFISIGQFVAEKLTQGANMNEPAPTSLFRDIQKRFGWK